MFESISVNVLCLYQFRDPFEGLDHWLLSVQPANKQNTADKPSDKLKRTELYLS